MRGSSRILNNSNCLLRIQNAVFKKDTTKLSPRIFPNPISHFEIYRPNDRNNHPSFWTVLGPEKSQLLQVISGNYIADPPLSRVYPHLAKDFKYHEIQFLNFRDRSGLDKVHMSARYETYASKGELEMSDNVNSVKNYITGANNYNVKVDTQIIDYTSQLLNLFNLEHLQNKWINTLSNGQLRRARIAKSLSSKPSLLIIDDPFLGLDPRATDMVSKSLYRVSQDLGTSIVLGLRVQDEIPQWIDHIAYADENGLKFSGKRDEVFDQLTESVKSIEGVHEIHERHLNKHKNPIEITNESLRQIDIAPHVEFNNASVAYRGLVIFKDFNWVIPKGSKWRILGDNGTGKTTLLSLITADHPQSWRSVMSINGIERKTGNGISFFDVNNRIGISSPELHALVPEHTKTMYEIILNGLVKDVGNSNFMMKGKQENLTEFGRNVLSQFQDRLDIYGNSKFTDLTITDQKLTLFLRAIIKKPELLILDEAFSCMDDEEIMIRCHDLIETDLKDVTVLTIGHIDWEVPRCDYLLRLYGDEDRHYKLFKYT
ncbi:P-loop containing nucleoside triphosphate hydrolase protein [Scheffersomyces amazonensis]|uniref:P-loop containing nucleoside triphosphate hydrolase protein n=1 Tax=Scheffersomyces amazonensis TaxID=1078765 RepID=UPI00315D9D02